MCWEHLSPVHLESTACVKGSKDEGGMRKRWEVTALFMILVSGMCIYLQAHQVVDMSHVQVFLC